MKITVSWIDGVSNLPVDAYLNTEMAAVELAVSMLKGADATIEVNDGYTVATHKYEDGLLANSSSNPVVCDLKFGVTVQMSPGDGIRFIASSNDVTDLYLNAGQVLNLRSFLKRGLDK